MADRGMRPPPKWSPSWQSSLKARETPTECCSKPPAGFDARLVPRGIARTPQIRPRHLLRVRADRSVVRNDRRACQCTLGRVMRLRVDDVQPRCACADGRSGIGCGCGDERVPCGTDRRLEIGDHHLLQGAPGRGPDEGDDAAEAYEEDARFAVAVAAAGRGRRAPLRAAAGSSVAGDDGRAGAARGWSGGGTSKERRFHCGSSGGVHPSVLG